MSRAAENSHNQHKRRRVMTTKSWAELIHDCPSAAVGSEEPSAEKKEQGAAPRSRVGMRVSEVPTYDPLLTNASEESIAAALHKPPPESPEGRQGAASVELAPLQPQQQQQTQHIAAESTSKDGRNASGDMPESFP